MRIQHIYYDSLYIIHIYNILHIPPALAMGMYKWTTSTQICQSPNPMDLYIICVQYLIMHVSHCT